jgi:acetyltransferase
MPARSLSEHASKALLAEYGVPLARERLVTTAAEAATAATALGFPVVVKLCGDTIAHKTERNLVRLGLRDAAAVEAAAADLLARRTAGDGEVALLVAEQVSGRRELIAGLVRDPQFGPCVMLGLGGILTEAVGDAVLAPAPLDEAGARRLIDGLRTQRLLGPFRGEPAVDRAALARVLVGLGRLGAERPGVESVDLNPLIVRAGVPIAVDALVVLGDAAATVTPAPASAEALRERFRPLFHPRGVIVAGVSTHPAKFGFTALHNLLACGYAGAVFPVHKDGAEVLGRRALRSVDEVPHGAADLVLVCTPPAVNPELLAACARRGVPAAFVASGGYGELGPEGKALEDALVAAANAHDMVLAGPNGQGLVSTADALCAQIVAPYPPPGRIAVASQSGNLASVFLNYACLTGIGITKAVSCGNSAQTTLADYLAYFAVDPDTAVALGYLEGVSDGRAFLESAAALTREKPLVLLRGGAASVGQRAAASHTGSMATDDRVFDGVCRQLGILRAPTAEEAFEWAATFATQPLPRGRRVVIVTTAGGWGVLGSDACAAAGLDVIALPDDLRARIDGMVPARWSRGNPIDPAGGETRDTIPELLDLVCAHPDVDAVLLFGMGIQANQAHLTRSGPFFPEHGLGRIVEYQERQDRRYAEAAKDASERHHKPVLVASELVHADRAYGNAGPLAAHAGGRLCHPSAHRAVAALRAMVTFAEHRRSLA